ncbi:copper resistance protein CopC [Nonomuraea sp. NPDC049421]|uniref:copper resistance CopC family protein n=1 Tax=Nonomuraea sp. NPDC049421 TaxID=3155275 RepID=UPI00343911DF
MAFSPHLAGLRSRLATLFATLFAALFAAAFVTGLMASPALAHDTLKRSSPAKDAEVTALEEIELEFTASVKFPFVVLHDASGKQLQLGEPELDGPLVTTGVTQPLAPGSYTIGWRVVSSDGHPIEGEIPFNVKGSTSPSASPTVTGETAAAPATGATAGPSEQGNPGADTAAGATTTDEAPAGVPAWIWGVLAVLVVLGVLVWLKTSRRGPDREELDAD